MAGTRIAGKSRVSAWISLAAAMAALVLLASPAPVPARDAPRAPAVAQPGPAARPAVAPARTPTPVRALSLADIRIEKELPITQWLRPGEYAWNDDGVPPGPTTIVVNIRARVLSAYRHGHEIGRSSIIYGFDGKPTPIGTFPILEKKARHFSTLYRGAPMPWMMRLTMDGVALHGALEMADDVATHGCIGLPNEFAALLFASAHVGDQVLIWKGERTPG
jgi:hypothetical protein